MSPPKKKSPRGRLLVWGLLFLAAVIGAVVVVRTRGAAVRVVPIVQRDIEQHIVASGRVWVPTRVQVAAQTPGLVIAVGAVEGQHVKRGDLLVQIDDAEARASVAQAKAAVEQSSARVQQLRRVGAIVSSEGLRQAQTGLERAETELERSSKLVASGSVPQAELDEARRALDIARAQKTVAEAQQLSSAPLGADSRLALSALMQAQAQLTGANVRLAQTHIEARNDGVILSRSIEPGDVVQPSRTLLVMAVDGDAELVFQPDERNLGSIRLGQAARASADAYPQDVFDAEVSYIAPSIDLQRGSVEVRLRVRTPPRFLIPDMTVSVDLTVESKKNALTLPSEAVRGAATATPWVFVVEQGRVSRRDVKLGVRGEGATEIVSGLDARAEVIIPEGIAVTAGQRVRAVRD